MRALTAHSRPGWCWWGTGEGELLKSEAARRLCAVAVGDGTGLVEANACTLALLLGYMECDRLTTLLHLTPRMPDPHHQLAQAHIY